MKLSDIFGAKTVFTIQSDPWTPDDTDDLQTLMAFPKFSALTKLLHKRLNERKEDLVNGKETRDRIEEISDLLLELEHYANPKKR